MAQPHTKRKTTRVRASDDEITLIISLAKAHGIFDRIITGRSAQDSNVKGHIYHAIAETVNHRFGVHRKSNAIYHFIRTYGDSFSDVLPASKSSKTAISSITDIASAASFSDVKKYDETVLYPALKERASKTYNILEKKAAEIRSFDIQQQYGKKSVTEIAKISDESLRNDIFELAKKGFNIPAVSSIDVLLLNGNAKNNHVSLVLPVYFTDISGPTQKNLRHGLADYICEAFIEQEFQFDSQDKEAFNALAMFNFTGTTPDTNAISQYVAGQLKKEGYTPPPVITIVHDDKLFYDLLKK